MEDRTLLEDAVSCTSLCKNDGVVCMCCVWLQRKHFNINGYCYSVCSQEAHIFAIYRWYSVFCDRMAGLLEGWTLEDGLLLEDMVPG